MVTGQSQTFSARHHGLYHRRGPLGSQWAEWRQTGRKWCPRCEAQKPLGEFGIDNRGYPRGWCRTCAQIAHAKFMRTDQGKASNRRYHQAHPERRWKNKVRWFTNLAVELGIIQCGLCEECGASLVQAHHVDYSRPLDVRWLCAVHHRTAHQKETKA